MRRNYGDRGLELCGGDNNTKFFHNFAKARGSRNWVAKLFDAEDKWVQNGGHIHNLFVDYFSNLFSSGGCNHQDLILEKVGRRVSKEMNRKLQVPFRQQDIELALKQMAPSKSPGFDGLSAAFFKEYWDVVGEC